MFPTRVLPLNAGIVIGFVHFALRKGIEIELVGSAGTVAYLESGVGESVAFLGDPHAGDGPVGFAQNTPAAYVPIAVLLESQLDASLVAAAKAEFVLRSDVEQGHAGYALR